MDGYNHTNSNMRLTVKSVDIKSYKTKSSIY